MSASVSGYLRLQPTCSRVLHVGYCDCDHWIVDPLQCIIIHCTYFPSSHWLRDYTQFWKLAQPTVSYLLADNWLICRLRAQSMISSVVVDSDWRFDNLRGSHLQRQSQLYNVSWWYYSLVIDLIRQLRRDVIGGLSVKPWCHWLWRIVISSWCVSIRLLSQLNSRILLVKLSVLQSFSRS